MGGRSGLGADWLVCRCAQRSRDRLDLIIGEGVKTDRTVEMAYTLRWSVADGRVSSELSLTPAGHPNGYRSWFPAGLIPGTRWFHAGNRDGCLVVVPWCLRLSGVVDSWVV